MALAIAPGLVPVGYARYTNLAAAVDLLDTPASGVAMPSTANYATITLEAQPTRVTFDGTTPTAAVGELFAAGTVLTFDNARDVLLGLKVIEVSASAALSVNYFRGPGG
jgi:hypothetical protein